MPKCITCLCAGVAQGLHIRHQPHSECNTSFGRVQTRVNATKLQRQDTVKIREKRKQKEQEEAASAPVADPAIKQAEQNGDGPLVLPDFTPLTNGNRCVSCFPKQGGLSCMVTLSCYALPLCLAQVCGCSGDFALLATVW